MTKKKYSTLSNLQQILIYHCYRYGVKQVNVARALNIPENSVNYHYRKFKDENVQRKPFADPTPLDVIKAEGLSDDAAILNILN